MSSMDAARGTEPAKGLGPASKHPLYSTWANMKSRCLNDKCPTYAFYGAKGIRVCDRWLASFWNFAADCEAIYSPGLTIDRIDSRGNYEPSNVRFVSVQAQSRNRSSNSWVEYRGQTVLMSDLAREHGLTPDQFSARRSIGWDVERIVSTPITKHSGGRGPGRLYEFAGEQLTVRQISERTGTPEQLIRVRLSHNWSVEEAATAPKNATRKTSVEIDGELAPVSEWCRRLGVARSRYEYAIRKGERPIDALKRLAAEKSPT